MPPETRSSHRISHGLVALGSAAVLAVYAAGYARTRSAAQRIEEHESRRVVVPSPVTGSPAATEAPVLPVARPERASAEHSRERSHRSPRTESAHDSATHSEGLAVATPPVAPPTSTPDVTTHEVKPAELAPPTPQTQYKDGTYYGWGTSRHGDIQAAVVIENGRIASARIAQCLTRYSCSWIDHLQGQVVSRQSPEVDYVSGATQSTNAFYYAVVEALAKAR
jgi:uncharacterized protein with FMN-binding domain